MHKNVAGQKIFLLAIDTENNVPKTGDAANLTAYASFGYGGATPLTDTSATEVDATNMPGLYSFDLTQAETNYDSIEFSGKSSTSVVRIVPKCVYPEDVYRQVDLRKVVGNDPPTLNVNGVLPVDVYYVDGELASILLDADVMYEGTIANSGTALIDLGTLGLANDALNDHLIRTKDVSTGKYYGRWITDFDGTDSLALLNLAIPATEAGIDEFVVYAIRRDVTTEAGDWDIGERAQIRHRLGIDGAAIEPATRLPSVSVDTPPIPADVTALAFGANAMTHAVDMPPIVEEGDLLLVLFANDEDSTVTTPDKWTLLSTTASGTAVRLSCYAKEAKGNEAGTVVNFETNADQQAASQCYRIKKGNWYGNISQGVQVGTAANGTSDNPDPPVVAPHWRRLSTLFIAVEAHDDGTSDTTGFPSNYVESVETASAASAADGCYLSSAIRQGSIISENPNSFTITSQEWVAQTIAIRPAQPMPEVVSRVGRNLDQAGKCVTHGVVDTGASATVIPTKSLDPAAVVANQWQGEILGFPKDPDLVATAALRGTKTRVLSNTSDGTFTVEQLPVIPAEDDNFVIE